MTFGSLFAGIGAGDLGLVRAGLTPRWQIEKHKGRRAVLASHFPDAERWEDATLTSPETLPRVDLIIGGDPCPYRSRARTIHGSTSPNLFPVFMRFVSSLRPLWVCRENVVANDANECWRALEFEGYRAVILECDGSEVTGQSRPREYLCGVLDTAGICPVKVFHQVQGDRRNPTEGKESQAVGRCLTKNPQRYDSRDNYVSEDGRGLRILEPVERERLTGLPDGWTALLSDRQRAEACGDAMIVDFPEWIGRRIIESASEALKP